MCVSVRDSSWSAARRKWGPETRARVTPSILSQQLERGVMFRRADSGGSMPAFLWVWCRESVKLQYLDPKSPLA